MTFKPVSNSNSLSPSWSTNLANSYPVSVPSTPTWAPPNREWNVSYPASNFNPPNYSSLSSPPNVTNSSFNFPPTFTPTSLHQNWNVSYPISHPSYGQLFTQANSSPLSSSASAPLNSLTHNFPSYSSSHNFSICRTLPPITSELPKLTPFQFSPKNSFSFNEFPSFSAAPSSRGYGQDLLSAQWNKFQSFAEENTRLPPPPVLWTIEDRSFHAFQKAMKLDMPFSSSSTTISFRPPTIDRGPFTVDVTSAKLSNGVPHISAARISVLDTAVGVWNGTKRAFALIGLEQMEISGQERMEILNTMATADQASRSALKEKMSSVSSSETHPVALAKNYARIFISHEMHKIFQEYSPLLTELSKYRADLTFGESASQNFWDAPRENGHAAIDKFCGTHFAQSFLSDPRLTLITKCELPFPWGGPTLLKTASAGEKALASSINRPLVTAAEKRMYSLLNNEPKLMYNIPGEIQPIFTIENGSLVGRVTTIAEDSAINLQKTIPGIAANRAVFERYSVQLRMQMGKPYVVDPKLYNIIEDVYRPYARVGSGSTAAAIRHELTTGERVCEKLHSQKGQNTIVALERWLKNHPTASLGDRAAAENIVKDLLNALRE